MSAKLKLDIKDLQLDMYVAEIDRPWLESSFMFQGFLVNSQDLLNQVSETCKYVYVDLEQSGQNVRPLLQRLSRQHGDKNPVNSEKESHTEAPVQKNDYLKLVDQFHCAKFLYSKTLHQIVSMLDNVRLGNSVDTECARSMVSEMISVVSRHPSTMIWLTYLKHTDDHTSAHSINVCIIALSFGHWLGLSKEKLQSLGIGAILHDIGKMKVPATILQKPGKLTDEEYKHAQRHPSLGYEALRNQPYMDEDVLDIVLHHHERQNGNGYPDALQQEQIRYLTRLVGLVDVYEAMGSDNFWRKAISPQQVLKQLYEQAIDLFGKEMVEQFIQCLGIFPIGCMVELETGEVAIVMAANEKSKLRPSILLVLDEHKQVIETRKVLNLANPSFASLRISKIIPPSTYDVDVKTIIEQEFLQGH